MHPKGGLYLPCLIPDKAPLIPLPFPLVEETRPRASSCDALDASVLLGISTSYIKLKWNSWTGILCLTDAARGFVSVCFADPVILALISVTLGL